MAYRDSYDTPGAIRVTPWVKRLLIANTAVFVLALVSTVGGFREVLTNLLAVSQQTVPLRPWTVLTYAFLHFSPFHLLFNLLFLYFFGGPLEERWGSRDFLKFYAVAALGGGLASLVYPFGYVLGASGAVYGLMVAYAMIWPDRQIHVWGIFPVAVKWLVFATILLSVSLTISGGGGTAHLAHLGGIAAGFLWMKSPWRPSEWGDVPTPARRKTASAASKKKGFSLPWKKGPQAVPSSPSPRGPAAPVAVAQPAAVSRKERELLDDVDRILDKISQKGLSSLSDEEKERLNEVSKRYRTN